MEWSTFATVLAQFLLAGFFVLVCYHVAREAMRSERKRDAKARAETEGQRQAKPSTLESLHRLDRP